MMHPWLTTNNDEEMHKAARDAFLSILLDYRENKECEPETVLLHQTVIGNGAQDTSVP